jgi:hypothetical protein
MIRTRLTPVLLLLAVLSWQGDAALNQSPRGLRMKEQESAPPPQEPLPEVKITEEALPPKEEKNLDPSALEEGTLCKWYGHGFVYIVSESGVRIAVNPFVRDVFKKYSYPEALPADIVLISSETADMAGGRDMTGLPQAFRSIAAIGSHSSHGIRFRGIRTSRDSNRRETSATNTIFTFEVDGLRFCHLGRLGHNLDTPQRRSIGRVDILFLPLGFRELDIPEWFRIAKQLDAKWIIPVCLHTPQSGDIGLRPWDEIKEPPLPVIEAKSNTLYFQSDQLPTQPTILLLEP